MSDESPRLVEVFSKAIEFPDVAARAAYLSEACGDDIALRRRVEALLMSNDAAAATSGFLNPSHIAHETSAPISERPGTVIGRYKLLEQIGEGGFGVVFMAEQEQPVRRRIALKIIKLGMDTKQVVARFEAERQALAMMDHPNIAKVFDAGSTDTGRPYFVMELVKGVSVTEYCDRNKLDVPRRIELLAQVCQAVQHAHQKGLIHRDIKPSNVLVNSQDDRPVVKVIDFGIAKATQSRLTEKTLFTEFRQLIGTPEYMSPEQADGTLDVDTRSDVYSLGVLLYELLTGTTPFDAKELRSKAFGEMQRIIREVEPPRPSMRLSTMQQGLPSVAAHRAVEPRKLDAQIRGELDWIVMRCLEKDRARRYESANSLALDLQRYLADEPVQACPPSMRYKLRKLTRRHRVLIVTTMAFALILAAGAVVSTWQAIRATRAGHVAVAERDAAEAARREAIASALAERTAREAESAQRQQAEEVAGYLTTAFRSPSPERDGRTITIAEVLERDAKELKEKFAGNPRTKAALLEAIANAYMGLGLFKDAIPLIEQSLELRQKTQGQENAETLSTMRALAWAYNRAGRFEEALRLDEQTLELRKKALGDNHTDTLDSMYGIALDYWSLNRHREAIPIMEETLRRRTALSGPENSLTIHLMNDLAALYASSGSVEKALPLQEQALELAQATDGANDVSTFGPRMNLAEAYRQMGRAARAIPLAEEGVQIMRAKLGDNHPDTLWAIHILARIYDDAGRPQDAVPLLEETLKSTEQNLGTTHPSTYWAMSDLGELYWRLKRFDDAIALKEKLVAIQKIARGEQHVDTLNSIIALGAVYRSAGQVEHARQIMEPAFALLKSKLDPQDPQMIWPFHHMGDLYASLKKPGEAASLFESALKLRRATYPAYDHFTLLNMDNLAVAYARVEKTDQAIALMEEAVHQTEMSLGKDAPATIKRMRTLASMRHHAATATKPTTAKQPS